MFGWILKLLHRDSQSLPPLSDPAFENVKSGFPLYIKFVSENPEWSDDQIIEALMRSGVESELAQELVYFVPSAFGRAIVQSMGIKLSNEYYLNNANNNSQKRLRLANVMSYAWAESRLDDFRGAEQVQLFMLIAGRSAELICVNNASQAGVATKDLAKSCIGPTIVTMRKVGRSST